MARPRTFDTDEAVDRAIEVFWTHGYQAASVRDLSRAMGIQSGSLYATFESKERLFQLALARYLERMAPTDPPGSEAIRAWFERVIADRTPTGCLLVGSAFEQAALDPASRALVARGLAGLEAWFAVCLRGRPGARADAAVLTATITGLHVLHRSGVSRPELQIIADRSLALVGA